MPEIKLLGMQGQWPTRLHHPLLEDLLQIAAQAGDRVAFAGAEQQAQAQQGIGAECGLPAAAGGGGPVCRQSMASCSRAAEEGAASPASRDSPRR